MICEIIVSETGCGIFLIFVAPVLKVFGKGQFFGTEKSPKVKYLKTNFFKFSAHRFVGLICTNKLEGFFFQKILFSRTWSFFYDCKNH